MENFKRVVGFFYISFLIHCYILLLFFFHPDTKLFSYVLQKKTDKTEQNLENVLVDTVTSSETTPEKGAVSDKANENTGLTKGKENYNIFNPNLKDKVSAAAPAQKQQEAKKDKDDDSIELVTEGKNSNPQEASDYHTSQFDPTKDPDATMDNLGDMSLATIPQEYAGYLLRMQRKIGQNWREFFPVFQYYQGLVKSGEVLVNYAIDADGNVQDVRLVRSYGYSVIDEASLNAIRYSRNFGPLPKALRSRGRIYINFRFVYVAR